MDKTKPMFTIGIAAEMAGLHPQTLRVYEAKGLILPARTPGGTRLYSLADVEALEHITELSEAGVNLEGITRILALEKEIDRLQEEMIQVITQLGKTKATLTKERRNRTTVTTTAIIVRDPMLPAKLD